MLFVFNQKASYAAGDIPTTKTFCVC